MAREQGDELGDEIAYTHPEHPEYGERMAYVPADVVNLEARGWVRKSKASPKRAAGSGSGGAAAESS